MTKRLSLLLFYASLLYLHSCKSTGEAIFPSGSSQESSSANSQFEIVQKSPGAIQHVWANEGSDKVTQAELRASNNEVTTQNSIWDGTSISLFGARNEVVNFNLVLEAPSDDAIDIEVVLTELRGPSGTTITSTPADGDGVFNYVGRDIELFYVRYLQIQGLSTLTYETYDERHIPERCRRPYDENGSGTGSWEDRPCHDQYYPDIAVPLELESPFTIAAGTNQSIWGDIYIPKGAPTGIYSGNISIIEGEELTFEIPVQLQVRDFSLPDYPNALTMIFFSIENINERYLGPKFIYPAPKTEAYAQSQRLADHHFQMAHRHKVSLIDSYTPTDLMEAIWLPRLDGTLFTNDDGYSGVGEGIGNNVYSIGTYGSWPWMGLGQPAMWTNTDEWVHWFDEHPLENPTEIFLFLIDESDNFEQTERWASWMDNNLGPGARLKSLATLDGPSAAALVPSLDIPASSMLVGDPRTWEPAVEGFLNDPDKRFYYYNGGRPGSGTLAIEDDGVALRASAWAQYKMAIDRWFYWESTYYNNFQCYGNSDEAYTNVFQKAHTFGCYEEDDSQLGKTGWNYTNGDGVLFYPGVDLLFPDESYGVMGPLASLRLKFIRRGLQDVDYLTMAAAVDPAGTAQIVEEMIPKVLWEYGVAEPDDPTWVYSDISWSTDPDVWEKARAELANIIEREQ